MKTPRISMSLSICAASMPLATLRSTLIASAVPARNTKTGAHRWLTQRTKKPSSGSSVPGMNSAAESELMWFLL